MLIFPRLFPGRVMAVNSVASFSSSDIVTSSDSYFLQDVLPLLCSSLLAVSLIRYEMWQKRQPVLIFKFYVHIFLFQISTPARQIGSSARTTVAFHCAGCVMAITTAATMKTNQTTLV